MALENQRVQTRWMLQTKRADFQRLAEQYGVSPVVIRIMRNRDVEEADIPAYLHGTLEELPNAHLLYDIDRAAEILLEKTREEKKIRIVGDYDIDGVCSTYILYKALKRIRAKADFCIPDRIKDGYGINEAIIDEASRDGIDTILTCDNGIAAIEQIKKAKEYGMTVIVTDHHDIMQEEGIDRLPPADAIVNPKQQRCNYPFSGICGGEVAYKLVSVLYEKIGIPKKEWEELLEFAAIATVGDVMKLQKENRIIVKQGLQKIASTKNIGLRKLIEKNNLNMDALSAYHIGFVIGPCINAGGRLQTALIALKLFLSPDENEAERLAQELKDLNDLRKDMTKEGVDQAIDQVEKNYLEDKVLVVYLPACHESLAGIIAGRLREYYNKPAICLTDGENGIVKGSGRSIEAYHMFQALVDVKDLLLKFGGHPMAAGLSLDKNNIAAFRNALNQKTSLTEEDFVQKIWIDVPMPVEYISDTLIRELECLEPFGQGNEKPLFAQKNMRIRSTRVMGKNKNVVKLALVSEQGTPIDALLFTDGECFIEELGRQKQIDVVYYPSVNEYNGARSYQIMIRNYKLH